MKQQFSLVQGLHFVFIFCLMQSRCQQLTQIKLTDKITIDYRLLDSSFEIYMEITCECKSWCAIGFGDSMINTDIIRIRKDGSSILVEDLYSKGYVEPQLDQYQDIVPQLGAITSTTIKGVFKRFTKSLDPSDSVLKLGEKIDIIWALSDNPSNQVHQSSGITTATFYDNLGKYDCHYKCIICRGPLSNQCLSCKSSNDSLSDGYCHENDIAELPVKFEITKSQFTIWWGYVTNFYIDFMIEVPFVGFVGLVFGNDFDKKDILVFQVKYYYDQLGRIKHKRIEFNDMYSHNKQTVPDYDKVLGGTKDIELLGYDFNEINQKIKIKFRRRMETGDAFDYVITKGTQNLIYILDVADSTMKNFATLPYVSFTANLKIEKQIKDDPWWKIAVRKSHTLFLFILWGPMSDISIVIIRYFKGNSAYLRIHGLIFVVINTMTILLVSFMIDINKEKIKNLDEKGYEKELTHFIFGIIILFLVFIQHALGVVLKIGQESSRKRFTVDQIKLVHRVVGIMLYLFTKTTLIIGVYMWEDKYYGRYKGEKYWFTVGMSLYYSFLVVFFITLEICYRSEPDFVKRRKRIVYQELDEFDQYDKLMNDLNSQVPQAEIIQNNPDLNYCILKNRVYDITDMPHPGGQYILPYVKGKDIAKYFFGGYSLEQFNMSTHTHRMYAQNYLNTKYIGTINNSKYDPFVERELDLKNNKNARPLNVWRYQREDDADVILQRNWKIFNFASEHYKIKNFLPGLQYFARYYTLRPHSHAMLVDTRQYSQVLCFQRAVIDFRIQMMQYFSNKMQLIEQMDGEGNDFENENGIEMPDLYSDTLPFLIKNMPTSKIEKGFSKFIYNSSHNLYEIEGPFGLGLELNNQSRGTHIIFAAGTGILPFLDLFDYLLRKCVYTVLADKCGDEDANVMNPFHENYIEDLPEDFKIILYGSFTTVEEFYGYKIISDVFTMNRMYNLNIFDCLINFSKGNNLQQSLLPTTNSRFSFPFIQNQLQIHGTPSKVYICGPPKMDRTVYNDCIKAQVPQSRIMIL